MNSPVTISHADRRPMYLQIMEQIRHRVAVGDWRPGQEIPSIRALAVTAQVSVITLKRADLELQREAVIVTGFAFRHKLTADGDRQIVSVHIPGDFVDLEGALLNVADHNVQTLTRCGPASRRLR